MVRHEQSLIDYIELVTGLRPRFGMAPPTTALPLFLREQFEFAEVELFGHRMLLAVERTPPDELSASEYARNAAMLRQGLGQDVVLVMAKLPSYVRNRLVREGVPFIVPGVPGDQPAIMMIRSFGSANFLEITNSSICLINAVKSGVACIGCGITP